MSSVEKDLLDMISYNHHNLLKIVQGNIKWSKRFISRFAALYFVLLSLLWYREQYLFGNGKKILMSFRKTLKKSDESE